MNNDTTPAAGTCTSEPPCSGCGYQGHEFGASYPDSVCIGGRLYDADDCDENGNLFEPLEFIPCPECNHAAWLENQREDIEEAGWIAAEDLMPREACPFPAAATRYPQDGETYRAWWLKGWDEAHSQNAGGQR